MSKAAPKLQRAVPTRAALSAADRIRAEAGRYAMPAWKLVEAAAAQLPGNVWVPNRKQFHIEETVHEAGCGKLQSHVASFCGDESALSYARQLLLLLRAEESRWAENPHVKCRREYRLLVMLELMDQNFKHAGWLDCETLEFRIFPYFAFVDGKVVGP